jgi:phenylalanyl-tRNA synthetase alpha chain
MQDDYLRKLESIQDEAVAAIRGAESMQELDATRSRFVGKNSGIDEVMQALPKMSKEERPKIGQSANKVKNAIEDAYRERRDSLKQDELNKQLASSTIDVTLPGTGRRLGHLHPLTQVTEELITVFYGMGFSVVEGPEIETDYYNFDALNTPPNHPARDEQDTFYTNVAPHVLLRSQTSTVQVRAMERMKPPLRVISPGRVYRNEEVNARKYPLFHRSKGWWLIATSPSDS